MNYSFGGKEINQVRDSVWEYEQMLATSSGRYFDIDTFTLIIDYYLNEKCISSAKNALNYAMKMHPNSFELLTAKTEILIEEGEYKDAIKILNKLENTLPGNKDVLLLSGLCNILLNKHKTAKAYFDKLIEFEIENSGKEDYLYLIGASLRSKKQYEPALNYLEDAYNINAKNSLVLYDLAFCYEKLGNFEKSFTFYDKYLEEDPFSASAWFNFGVVASRLGNFKKTLEAYEFSIAVNPDFADAYFNLAVAYSENGNSEKAKEKFTEYVSLNPNDTEALCYLADLFECEGNFDYAELYYTQALVSDENNETALYGMATLEYRRENYRESLLYINSVLEKNKKKIEYIYIKGLVLKKLGFLEDSLNYLSNAAKSNPKEIRYILAYADILFLTEAKSKAIKLLEEAEKKFKENVGLFSRLAAFLYRIERYKSIYYLGLAMQLDSDVYDEFIRVNPEALNDVQISELVAKYIENY